MNFNDHLIPVERGQAVGAGWPYSDGKALGVTWHWTATWDLRTCRKILGGANAMRKGRASAHFGVGLTRAAGTDRYVSLENRSWHAGANQTLDHTGAERKGRTKGAHNCVGIEVVNIGYARKGVTAGSDWIVAASENGRQEFLIPHWPEEQIAMCIALGKHIIARFPNIRWEQHHGHSDICPGYKFDPLGFPFARILRAIYDNPEIPDIWTPYLTIRQRQQALLDLGYDLGKWGADGDWGRMSGGALLDFQADQGIEANGMWTKFVSHIAYEALK